MTNKKDEIPYRPFEDADIPERPYPDWTTEQRLRFMIDFCQEDLGALRPGDLLNLREDLWVFMYGPPFAPGPPNPGGVRICDDDTLIEAPVEELIKIQKEVYEILNLAASWNKQINPKSIAGKGPLPVYHISVGLVPLDNIIEVQGSSRDCLVFALIHLLRQESGFKKGVSVCPGCGRIFYRIKRQKYCSQRCSNRMYMQEYRTKNSESVSESNHKQYEKRTKAKTGSVVKVGRRPGRKDHGR